MRTTKKELLAAADEFQRRGDEALRMLIDLKPSAPDHAKASNERLRGEARLNHTAEVALRQKAEYLP